METQMHTQKTRGHKKTSRKHVNEKQEQLRKDIINQHLERLRKKQREIRRIKERNA